MEYFTKKANENVQRYLGDIDESSLNDAELFYEEVYTLAHDGAVDAGASMQEAQTIAEKICSHY